LLLSLGHRKGILAQYDQQYEVFFHCLSFICLQYRCLRDQARAWYCMFYG
jgi:hypothetical protein